MGELKSKRIVQSRIWLDPDSLIIPDYDYDFSYPITVYDAVKQNMDDNSATLTDEIASIYRLIYSKQDIVEPGIAGQLMTFTGVRGQIGAIDIVKMINKDPAQRSHSKVVSERAIGDLLDTKVSLSSFNNHINDGSIHINDVERSRWNAMAPLSTLQAHISNTIVHVTDTERANWNSKAKQSDLDDHIYNMNNPHNVTAHQTGTYTRREIDEMFENIRASFFNYLNISWDDRNNQATLLEYHPANWNPNYILSYEDELPDVPDPSLTYFALKPATDYKTNETQDCIIYVKRPGLTWQEVGFQTMQVGDMVIRYPDTTMFVWVQGRWLKLFTGNKDDEIGGGKSDLLWRPHVDEEGTLTFELSKSTDPPGPFIIKGKDGYTPVKGIDYVDGKDGEGVAIGGVAGDLLVKLTDENYDTSWKSFLDILNDYAISGGVLPDGLVLWEYIKGRPQWYNSLGDNEDGFITQRAATRQFEVVGNNINQILERLDLLEPIKEDLYDHINDFNNPHRVTPAMIGAITTATFLDHTQNFNNPHNVTAGQLGLGNVNNTSDMDKPISTAVQLVIDEILKKINDLGTEVKGLKYITDVTYDASSCDIIFEYADGTELKVHIPIIEVFSSIYYDQAEKELVIILPDGEEHRVDIAALIQEYFGSISDNIQVSIDDDNVIKATVVPGSIGELEIASSVHLRGAPTTMTQPVSDRSTRVATTEFVSNQVIDNLISYDTDRPLSANMGRILNEKKADIDEVIKLINDMSTVEVIDNLDSTNPLAALSANMGRYLDLTKAPRVHTSPSGSTFGRATISLFGHSRASDIDPLMDGTVFRGTDDGYYARADHRHPTDTTRAPMHWPDVGHNQYELTGKPCTVMPPDDSNDHQIANTEWVRRNAVGVMYGKSDTAANTAIKIATLESTFMEDPVFLRQIGSTVTITFKNGNTAANPKMNVHGTGAAPILYGGKAIINDMIKAGYSYTFSFDGTNWLLLNPTGTHILPDSDNSNSLVSSAWVRRNIVGVAKGESTTASTNANKTAKLRSTYMNPVVFIRQIGSAVAITFSEADLSGNTVTTLNVENTGAAPIKFGGRELVNGMLGAHHTHFFVFEGTEWRLINPVPGTGYGTITIGPGPSSTRTRINQAAGHNGMTTQADGLSDVNGQVKRVWFTIPFDARVSNVEIEVSNESGAWAAKMGDGTMIDINTPVIIDTTCSGVVVQFSMNSWYPSNSPCQLVYKTNQAYIKIKEVN